jgi:hypothetical protein
MSIGQVALAAGQVLLIVFGSLTNGYAVYVIASHVSTEHTSGTLTTELSRFQSAHDSTHVHREYSSFQGVTKYHSDKYQIS